MTTPRWTGALVAASAWTLAFAIPWPDALGGLPWLRVLVALLLFSVPGLCLHALLDERRELDAVTRLPGGLCLSVGVTGLLGFTGCVLRLPTGFVTGGLFTAGLLAIVLLARRGGVVWPRLTRPDTDALLDGAALGVALLLTGWLCIAPALSSDDLTHVARVAAFQQRTHLGFGGIAFGGDNVIAPRYWLAFWPLCEAILSSLAHVQPLELTTNLLGGLLGMVAGLAVFNLARALELSRRLAVVAVLAQLAVLLVLGTRDQPGVLFFNRITEDKFLAFFVLAPICMQILLSFIDHPTRGRLARVALAWTAMTFSHATSLGMVALVVCTFCVLELVLARRRAALFVLALVVPITAAAALVRFVPHVYQQHVFFDVDSARQEKEITAGRKRRIHQIRGTPFYGIGPASAGPTMRALGATMLVLAALQARRERVARYVLAALCVIAAAVLPYTGWLLGAVLTPFHLWRILSLAPFGIATAFAASLVLRLAVVRSLGTPRADRIALTIAVLALASSYRAAARPESRLGTFNRAPDWRQVLTVAPDWRPSYAELDRLASLLQRESEADAVVLASRRVNDLVPSLTARARLLTFRSPMHTVLHAGIPPREARRRWQLHSAIVDGTASAARIAHLLAERHVRLALVRRGEEWLQRVPEATLPRELLGSFGDVDVYRLGTNELRS